MKKYKVANNQLTKSSQLNISITGRYFIVAKNGKFLCSDKNVTFFYIASENKKAVFNGFLVQNKKVVCNRAVFPRTGLLP